MIVELINTGTELTLGYALNTHQQWLGRKLADLNLPVSRQTTVPDSSLAIQQALRESLARADLIIVTGGLGPTSDDVTREAAASVLGRALREDQETVDHIAKFFAARGRPMLEATRAQALAPEGATTLPNAHGTAPGLILEAAPGQFRDGRGAVLLLLPGPPRELEPMFLNQAATYLRKRFANAAEFACRTLRTCGLGESWVEQTIAGPLAAHIARGLEIGYCARPGEVEIRLCAGGAEREPLALSAEKIVRELLGPAVFGEGDQLLEEMVAQRLAALGMTLALAESCTGGRIANRITDVPGASAVFLAGWVTYSNPAKEACLGVSRKTLAQFGAVSEETAREMAEGARRAAGSDWAVSATGIAGPSGGSPEKPVGAVFIALAGPARTEARRFFNPYDRETFKQMTSQQALFWLWTELRQTVGSARSRQL